jgi:dienelactone hydrolase
VLALEGFGTLLVDLLTPEEQAEDEATARLRFDVELLAARLVAATDWLLTSEPLAPPEIGYVGASTGAAAALIAASERADVVRAVVSRGERQRSSSWARWTRRCSH